MRVAVIGTGRMGSAMVGRLVSARDGTVLGLIFAASTTDQQVGYALTSPQIAPKVAQARRSAPVSTGPCSS